MKDIYLVPFDNGEFLIGYETGEAIGAINPTEPMEDYNLMEVFSKRKLLDELSIADSLDPLDRHNIVNWFNKYYNNSICEEIVEC